MFPGRIRKSTARMFRRVPNRLDVKILDLAGDHLCDVDDAWNVNVSNADAQMVVNVRGYTQTWKLPAINVQDDFEPRSGHRIREKLSGRVWEIRSVRLDTGDHTWSCVCVEMEQNEGR